MNLGSGAGHYLSASAKKYALDSAVTANVDIGLDEGNIPNYYQANLNFRLPFEDNQFSCFFASHCLEHIPDWESALQEWLGIAGRSVVVLPHPLNMGQLSDKTHTRYVSQGWINQVKSYPGGEVYD
jgi:ubiquinone/menaquinone biosynthesis C-methylase UbiE